MVSGFRPAAHTAARAAFATFRFLLRVFAVNPFGGTDQREPAKEDGKDAKGAEHYPPIDVRQGGWGSRSPNFQPTSVVSGFRPAAHTAARAAFASFRISSSRLRGKSVRRLRGESVRQSR